MDWRKLERLHSGQSVNTRKRIPKFRKQKYNKYEEAQVTFSSFPKHKKTEAPHKGVFVFGCDLAKSPTGWYD